MVNLANTKFEHSLNTFQAQYRRYGRYYDLYRGIYQGKFHPYRNNVHVPASFWIVQSAVARKMQMMFGATPYIRIVGGAPEDQQMARRQQALLNMQLDDAKTVEKALQFLTMAEVYGTAIFRWFWDRTEGVTSVRFHDGVGEQNVTSPTTKFNGPNWEPVDVIDFYPEPGRARLDQMEGVTYRYWMELEDVKIHAEQGLFKKAGVRNLTFNPPSPDVEAAFAWRRNVASGGWDDDKRSAFDKFAKPVEILEYHGRVPRNLVDDGEYSRVITIANRRHLLRNIPQPTPNRKIPFGAYSPTPDPHYFHGPGKIEINAKLQYATNRLANQKLDALDLTVDPMYVASRRGGFDARNLKVRPGKVLWTDNVATDDALRPLIPDMSRLATVYAEMDQHDRWMQKSAGIIDDTVQGIESGGGRTTATEFQGRSESATTRILMEVRQAERQWLEVLGAEFIELSRAFLPFPQMVRMIGANAVVDPVKLTPLAAPDQQVDLNDMLPDYDKKAVGATRQLGIASKQQNLTLLGQMLAANPVAASVIDWMAFTRMVLEAYEIQNVDELMQTDQFVQQQTLQALTGGGGGSEQGEQGGQTSSGGEAPQPDLAAAIGGLIGNPGLGGEQVA